MPGARVSRSQGGYAGLAPSGTKADRRELHARGTSPMGPENCLTRSADLEA